MRLPTKPWHTPTTTPSLPIAGASFTAVATTSFEASLARTISRSFMTLAGEKKCSPITDSGRRVAVAISSTLR